MKRSSTILAVCLAVPAFVAGGAAPAQAHAFAQRLDLPAPLLLYLAGAGATVAFSFVLVALFTRRARAGRDYPRLDLLRWRLGRALASPLVLNACRLLSVAIFVLVVTAGLIGTQDPFRNIATIMVWVIWWVGMAYVSALVGDLWRLFNPWTILYDWTEMAARRLGGVRGLSLGLAYPEKLGMWPAILLFFAFAWTEQVWHGREIPGNLSILIALYSVVTWAGMVLFGRDRWLENGEAFSVLFGLLARFAPFEARTIDGRREFNLRPPGIGLLTSKPVSGSMVLFVLVMLSTVTFDGIKETPAWTGLVDRMLDIGFIDAVLMDVYALTGDVQGSFTTVAILVFPFVFIAVFGLFCGLMAAAGRGERTPGVVVLARSFVLTLVPIAIAYHLAHYLSFLLVAGQLAIPLVSDPFGFGWDLFGTTTYFLDIAIVGTEFVWVTSIAAIVTGHVFAVYLAHVVALGAFADAGAARRSQYPMLVLMVGYTMTSLWILAQPVVEYSGG
jgi:hypothetical protein